MGLTDLSQDVKQQVAALILTPNNKSHSSFSQSVQGQRGSITLHDLYSIAFAASISTE